MSRNGFKIELVCNTYFMGGVRYERPYSIVLPEDAEALKKFKGNPAFKLTPLAIPSIGLSNIEPNKEQPSGFSVVRFVNIPKKVIDSLVEAGYTTAEKILSDDVTIADLMSLNGIGEAMANKVIESCEEALMESENKNNNQ